MKRALLAVTGLLCICCIGLYLQRQAMNNQDATISRLNNELSVEKEFRKWSDELIANLRSQTNRLAKELAGEKILVSILEPPTSRPGRSGLSDKQIDEILGPEPKTEGHYIPPQQDVAQVLHDAEVLKELRRSRDAQEQQNWNQQFWNLDRSLNSGSDSFELQRQTRALEDIRDELQQQRLDNLIHPK